MASDPTLTEAAVAALLRQAEDEYNSGHGHSMFDTAEVLALAAEVQRLRGELDLWRPLTPEEAQKAYDEAEADPLPEDQVAAIVARAVDPGERITNSEQAQLAAANRTLAASRDAWRAAAEQAAAELLRVAELAKIAGVVPKVWTVSMGNAVATVRRLASGG